MTPRFTRCPLFVRSSNRFRGASEPCRPRRPNPPIRNHAWDADCPSSRVSELTRDLWLCGCRRSSNVPSSAASARRAAREAKDTSERAEVRWS